MGYFSNGGDVEYLNAGVAEGFGEDQSGLGANGFGKSLRVSRVDKSCVDAKTRQGEVHHVVGAAVNIAAGHNVVSGTKQGGYGKVEGGLTAGCGYGTYATF